MTSRKLHKTIGLILLLPFISWSLTAVFFLVRPRYEQAYETLAVHNYPLLIPPPLQLEADWQELRWLRTVLGEHLLVKRGGSWQQLDPQTLQPRPQPTEAQLRLLLADAFTANAARYGDVTTIDVNRVTTTTGVNISFDWDTLSFTQQGRDTRAINRVYDIHYLEWTGIRLLDKVLGLSGLFLLMYMTYSGARLALGSPSPRTRAGE